jgi:hypothetical protein
VDQPSSGKPIDHRAGGRWPGAQSLRQRDQRGWGFRADEMQREQLRQGHFAAGPHGGASSAT